MNPILPLPNRAQPGRRSLFLRRAVFTAAVLVTLITAFYTIENWRGRRAWEECQRELTAQGAQLDWPAYVPSHVPDEQNFIKTPLLEAVGYRGRVATNAWRPLAEAGQYLIWDAWVDSQAGRKFDWSRCQSALRGLTNLNLPPLPQAPAADLLQAFHGIEPQLEELRAASLKPLAHFDIDHTAPFEEAPDVNFVAMRTLSQLLAYHACAELALDHSDTAFGDVRVIHRLSDALKDEHTLVALMIRVAVQGLALEPFWEGWTEERWSERELKTFQDLFGRVNLLPEIGRVMQAERAGVNALVEKYGLRGNEFWRVTMRSEPQRNGWGALQQQAEKLAWKLIPRGWIGQNLASYNHRIQDCIPPSLQSQPPRISPIQVNQMVERISAEIPGGPYGWLSQMAIPNFAKALHHVARIQTLVNEARLVCALERCRKAQGHYPESLAQLTPQFIDQLPLDVIDGRPMRYRRANDGKFLLYSIGWNEIDDAGTPSPGRDTSGKPESPVGDWVWRFPLVK